MHDLFLSYHWRDHEAVEKIAHALHERGLDPFLDRWYLVPGRSWVELLEQTLHACKATAIFLGPHGMGPWQQREKGLALDRQAKDPSFAVIPVLLPGADPALGFLSLNTWVDLRKGGETEALEILVRAVRGQPPGRALNASVASALATVCPYRGLRPFREEDQPFFCGRESFTATLVEEVGKRSFVAVVGPSGSGKSSVVRAGLMPALRRRADRRVWDMVHMSPEDRPLYALAYCLVPLLAPEVSEVDRLGDAGKLAGSLAAGEVLLRSVVDRALAKQPGTDRLLLVVDQWEELYTLCHDDAARHRFVEQLLEATANGKLTVVLTLRGDFFGHALGDRRLSDRLQGGVVNVAPMTRDELNRAIVEPADKVKLSFEDRLVERILDDVGDEPGSLPLLEFLLTELWDGRRGGQLLHQAYDDIGGVRRAIAKRAEQAFARLGAEEQEAAHWALVKLVRPGEGTEDTRRRAALEELGSVARVVVAKLTSERLLVTARDAAGREVVEVGHEALIREWERLRQWVNEDREFLRTMHRLEEEAANWKAQGQPPDLLLPAGRRLAEGEELLRARAHAVSAQVQNYIEASAAAERVEQDKERRTARRNLRRTQAFAVVVTILLLVNSGFAYMFLRQRVTAIEQKEKSDLNFKLALESALRQVDAVQGYQERGAVTGAIAKDLLTKAEGTLGSLEKLEATPEITEGRIRLLLQLSDAYANLGVTKEVLQRAEHAKTLAAQLVASDSGNDRWQHFLFASSFRIGDALSDQSEFDRALQEYQVAYRVAELLVARKADVDDRQHELIFIHNKIADTLKIQGNLSDALARYRQALVLVEKGAATNPTKDEWQREIATSSIRIGDILALQKKFDDALLQFRRGLEIRKRLAAKEPDNDVLQSNLSVALNKLGDVLKEQPNLDAALVEYRAALVIRTHLVAKDPSSATSKSYLARQHRVIGDVLKDQGKLADATEHYRRALGLRKEVVEADPNNPGWRVNLAIDFARLGSVLAQHAPEEALREYRSGLAVLLELLAAFPDSPERHRELFRSRVAIGDILAGQHDASGAASEYRAALKIAEWFLAKDPNDAAWQANAASMHQKIAEAAGRAG